MARTIRCLLAGLCLLVPAGLNTQAPPKSGAVELRAIPVKEAVSEADEGDACIRCHKEEVNGFARSKMAHSMRLPTHEPEGIVRTPQATLRMYSNQDGTWQTLESHGTYRNLSRRLCDWIGNARERLHRFIGKSSVSITCCILPASRPPTVSRLAMRPSRTPTSPARSSRDVSSVMLVRSRRFRARSMSMVRSHSRTSRLAAVDVMVQSMPIWLVPVRRISSIPPAWILPPATAFASSAI